MNKIPQNPLESTNPAPLFAQDLASIKSQVAEWDRTFGPGKVSQWLFDVAFNQLHEAKGFKFTNELLTHTRRGLKKAEASKSLERARRCKKAKAQSKAEGSEQLLVEAAQ